MWMADITFLGSVWFVLTAFVAAVMWAAQIGPKAAASNLSDWATWLGFTPPQWLRSPSADYVARRGGPIVLAVLAVIGVWIFISITAAVYTGCVELIGFALFALRRRSRNLGIALTVVSFVALGIGIWIIISTKSEGITPVAANAANSAVENGPNSPLAKAVDAFLAKTGKTAHWNETIDGHQYVGFGSFTGIRDDETITYWDYASLGPWPTSQDKFGDSWLRALPKKRPNFKLQSDRENFRAEVGELQKILNRKMVTMLNLSDDLFASPVSQDSKEKISKIENIYQEVGSALFIRTDHSSGTLFDKSNYKELLMGAVSDDWQTYWKDYHEAFVDLKRVIALIEQARKYPDNTELTTLTSNIETENELFRDRTRALRFWLGRENQCIELLIAAI
jgi:hypothetical protein